MDKLLLYKALKNKSGAEISASGNPVTLSGTLADNPLKECKIYGWSKQETTKGKNLFDFSKLVSDGVNVMNYEKQTITVPARTNNTGYNQTLRDLCPGITPGTYVFSMKRSNPNSGNGSYFLEAAKDFPINTPIELTDELLDNHISWYNSDTSEVENVISEIQIEKGTEATDYEPYTGGQPSPNPEHPQEIESAGSDGKINLEVHGKNLFNITIESKCDKSGESSTKRIILPGEYILGLTYTNICANYLNNVFISQERISFFSDGVGYGIGIGVIAEKGKKYVISGEYKNGDMRMVFYDKSGGIMCNTDDNPFVVPEGTKYAVLLLRKSKNTTEEVVFKNIQVEEAISPTAYEPYHEPQSLSIQTPTGLPAIPVNTDGNYTDTNGQQWIADYIDLKRGKYVQRVWQKTFDGSESWGVYTNTGFYLADILPEKMKNREMLCNQLRGSDGGIASDVIIVGAFGTNSTIYIDNCTLRDNTLADKGLSNWKAHLAKHPLVVMTYLAEPIERNLTPSEIQAYQELTTYAGTTILENDADCYMEVSAGGGDTLRAKKLALLLGD
uniref:Uncharacterized protein n=1 Tax=Siphoviridae sp. ctNyC15 TaxID=2826307 RepID=A0A8S5NFB2_9CAUD|nr:MAG TPA: hypothetical protein [Siphoviridae sp. ctNyC15]